MLRDIEMFKIIRNGKKESLEIHPAVNFPIEDAFYSDGVPVPTHVPPTHLVRLKVAGKWYPEGCGKIFYRKRQLGGLISGLNKFSESFQ